MRNKLNLAIKAVLFFCATGMVHAQDRPNIIWLVSEDNSIHYMDLYTKNGVSMPAIEQLAENGIAFNHAYSNAPVCSVARSTIISGCYAPRFAAQFHRKMQKSHLPDSLHMFPYYLREAGYYTTNNAKEDYNFETTPGTWDESSRQADFRNRQKDQPFFHVQNFGITHEGRLHASIPKMDSIVSTSDVATDAFPIHPDSKTFRSTNAYYRHLHQKLDEQIASFLQTLKDEGLLENTIIFYYGDHGGVLPGSKGYIYDRGVHVPMVVQLPEKWKHLAPAPLGSRSDAFVEFIDLAPTVLNLAGVAIPNGIDGTPFLGKDVSAADWKNRNTAFFYADRFDEKYDFVRAIQKGKYKYIRNYQPFNIDGLFNEYRYRMQAYQEWNALNSKGKLNAEQRQFFAKKAPEALYDLEMDPFETKNLAGEMEYSAVLEDLRYNLEKKVLGMPDLSFFPEPFLVEHALKDPLGFAHKYKKIIKEMHAITSLQLLPFDQAQSKIDSALQSQVDWHRYWAIIVCSTFGQEAREFEDRIRQILETDQEVLNQMRAVEFLLLNELEIDLASVSNLIYEATSETACVLMLNSLALIKSQQPDFHIAIDTSLLPQEWVNRSNDLVKLRLDYLKN